MDKFLTLTQYEGHDCHKSPEDGCTTCESWAEQGGEPTRADLIRSQKILCEEIGAPFFAPHDGNCFKCRKDCVNDDWASKHITGCSKCHYSFCD